MKTPIRIHPIPKSRAAYARLNDYPMIEWANEIRNRVLKQYPTLSLVRITIRRGVYLHYCSGSANPNTHTISMYADNCYQAWAWREEIPDYETYFKSTLAHEYGHFVHYYRDYVDWCASTDYGCELAANEYAKKICPEYSDSTWYINERYYAYRGITVRYRHELDFLMKR